MKKINKQSAFTIVELLVVIVVIGILAAITIVSYTGIIQRANASVLQSDLDNASKQLKLFQVEHSVYPSSLNVSNCPLDASSTPDNTYCLKPGSGITYKYSVDNTLNPKTFSLYATKDNNKYFTTANSTPAPTTQVSATGGTVTSLNGYNIHTFTTSGTFTVAGDGNVEVLVIAGGGGGANTGSGGGAGGYIYNNSLAVSNQSYSVTVGAGGLGGVGTAVPGVKGNNSTFSTITTEGGGDGVSHGGRVGGNGGSGGGGSIPCGVGTVPGGTGSQGNEGGTAEYSGSCWVGGSGGGGGAGSVGSSGTNVAGSGNGGVGLANSISGSPTYYSGGGAGSEVNGNYVGAGGIGGGGDAIKDAPGNNGIVNTGGGGAGGAFNGGIYCNGGNGGSGIVIIRYPN